MKYAQLLSGFGVFRITRGIGHMVAYAFYWIDETDKARFIGLLPERRKDPERITEESIMK